MKEFGFVFIFHAIMSDAGVEITQYLLPFLKALPTRLVRIEQGLLAAIAPLLSDQLPSGRWLLLSDDNTHSIAGAKITTGLEGAGIPTSSFVFPNPMRGSLVCSDDAVEAATEQLESGRPFTAVVAVGAGTINDIAKLASHRAKIPFAAVPTAPSMNGYISGNAAVLSRGVKVSVPCRPPVACLFDVDLIRHAPYRMIAAGLGDLLSRSVSLADWQLSDCLLGTGFNGNAESLLDTANSLILNISGKLPDRDAGSIAKFAAALVLSGAAMGLAGSSAPASGGEHLISHYLDMVHTQSNTTPDLHGCQVGVAVIATASLYERLVKLDPDEIEVDRCVAQQPPWPRRAESLTAHFGSLAEAVLPQAQAIHAEPEELRDRLGVLKKEWPSLISALQSHLRPASEIRAELASAQAPVHFEELGCSSDQFRHALLHGKDIRARYSVLHLLSELSLLASWSTEILAERPA